MITTKTNKNPQHNRYHKSPRRKAEDKLAKGLNYANGGCFYGIRAVKKKHYEEQQLQKRFKELTGPCMIIRPAHNNADKVENNKRNNQHEQNT